ncbi:MAG TPA: cobyrinic acid a,c-diamide synthase [Acidothermaceae bacterium]|nr:cobyrinic acid a,c-diamide synthase [Acidothermaceae bacterium]
MALVDAEVTETADAGHFGQLGRALRPADGRRADADLGEMAGSASADDWDAEGDPAPLRPVRIGRRAAEARPTGRERHDEKITVYCSPEELLQIEHARLMLRGSHSLAVDRGRIVREAIAVVFADLEAKGESSILVRRLRGR